MFDKYYLNSEQLSKSDIVDGFKMLSQLLNIHFGKKCFILMDEYDAPINYSFFNCNKEVSKDVVDIVGKINEATFKDNKYLKKALITGILPIDKGIIFSGTNNVIAYNLLDSHYFKYYGFTE